MSVRDAARDRPMSLVTEAASAGDRTAIDIHTRAQAVADIAAAHAVAVDRDAVFPTEAIAEAKRNGLMALLIPREFGGGGATMSEVADVCYTLGQACASTAMIVAMHQAALACVVRHHGGSEWHCAMLRRVAMENLLLASSTTEGGGGGNVRSSSAPLVREGNRLAFARAATVMSYGGEADGIVTTARRDADAAASDQALVVFLKDDYRLTPTGGWDTLGMRGTCSAGFSLAAEAGEAQILPVGYDKIHPQTMVPVSHLAWASTWTGIAAAAVSRAQMFVAHRGPPRRGRDAARRRALHRGHRGAAQSAWRRRRHGGALRADRGRSAHTRRAGDAGGAEPVQGRRLRARGGDGDPGDARLRPCRLPQRRRVRASAATCATCSPPRSWCTTSASAPTSLRRR